MNKSEQREVTKLQQWHAAGLVDVATCARTLSALIRASMRNKAKSELIAIATGMGCTQHPEFII